MKLRETGESCRCGRLRKVSIERRQGEVRSQGEFQIGSTVGRESVTPGKVQCVAKCMRHRLHVGCDVELPQQSNEPLGLRLRNKAFAFYFGDDVGGFQREKRWHHSLRFLEREQYRVRVRQACRIGLRKQPQEGYGGVQICLIPAKCWPLWRLFDGCWSKRPNLHGSHREPLHAEIDVG